MTDEAKDGGLLPPDGESIGDVLTKVRLTGRAQGLDAALAIIAAIRKDYDRQFMGPMLSGPEARRVFSLAMAAAEKAIKAAKRPVPRPGTGERRQV